MSPALEKKTAEVELLKKYIQQHRCVGLVHLDKINAKIVQSIRAKLRGKAIMRLSKKRLQKMALSQVEGKPNLEKLVDLMEGASAMVFTDMDPLELRQFFEEAKEYAPPKGGDVAPVDIVIPAGNTGILSGPIISELNDVLGLRTRLEGGTIWIREDKVTHKKGDLIDAHAAQLLARLDIKPIEVKLDLYAAWQDGEVLGRAILGLDYDEKRQEIAKAASEALQLALACEVVDDLTVEPLIQRAVRHATAMLMELPIFVPEAAEIYLQKAAREAAALERATKQ